jgi:hypothetical protein
MDDQLLAADGTNARPLFCRQCGSQFLSEGKARHEEHEATRAHIQRVVNVAGGKNEEKKQQPKEAETEKTEEVAASCWRVDDMWDFDNFGQSRPVAGAATSGGGHGGDDPITPETVYVVCADCEVGPVGVKWKAGEPYYLAHSLLAYERKEGAPVNGALPAGMSEDFVRQLIAQREEQQAAAGGQDGGDEQPPVIVVEEDAVAGASGAEAASGTAAAEPEQKLEA